ncbi:hypothetical protein PIB30_041494 [Stylosanthes scabra]|uniref:Uncharacterized protein n=1 Tax=Stylosanthes scabra TaxID=79078 RepID=A0ABU6TEK3_9FABA|nr:hypothetical protein [Stylosanthes scabra]
MQDSHSISTPMLSSQRLVANIGTPFENPLYRSIVGAPIPIRQAIWMIGVQQLVSVFSTAQILFPGSAPNNPP